MANDTQDFKVSLVLAVAKNGVIGDQNKLPWNLPSDLKRFKETTMGHPVIMGRTTFDSIGKPLPGRDNIVLTRSGAVEDVGVHTANSLEEACSLAKRFAANRQVEEIMIIGGGDVFEQTRGMADKVYLTTVDMDVDGDTTFRALNAANWKEISSEDVEACPKDSADFNVSVYERG